jgi:hypothetical protein
MKPSSKRLKPTRDLVKPKNQTQKWRMFVFSFLLLLLYCYIHAEKNVAANFRVRHVAPYCLRWEQFFCWLDSQHLWWLYTVLINKQPRQRVSLY